jgi:hypothetical protein
MDSRTLEILADQAEREVEEAQRREWEGEVHLRLLHSELMGKKDTLRVLRRQLGLAREVRWGWIQMERG